MSDDEIVVEAEVTYPSSLMLTDGSVVNLELLPTKKPHLSFSEVSCWWTCSWKHKRKHVDGIDLEPPSIFLYFGTAMHAVLEDYVKTREMKPSIAFNILKEAFDQHLDLDGFTVDDFKKCTTELKAIFAEFPVWFDATFPGWELIDAEHPLYEHIEGQPHAFKGFIDAVIRVPGKKGEHLIWLLDWKSTIRGWFSTKRQDPKTSAQLVFYKTFWSRKTQTPMKNIRCGFVLLKRVAKDGERCELFAVSVGEKTSGKSLKVLNNMISSVKRGIAFKNRTECRYCEFKDTPYCT